MPFGGGPAGAAPAVPAPPLRGAAVGGGSPSAGFAEGEPGQGMPAQSPRWFLGGRALAGAGGGLRGHDLDCPFGAGSPCGALGLPPAAAGGGSWGRVFGLLRCRPGPVRPGPAPGGGWSAAAAGAPAPSAYASRTRRGPPPGAPSPALALPGGGWGVPPAAAGGGGLRPAVVQGREASHLQVVTAPPRGLPGRWSLRWLSVTMRPASLPHLFALPDTKFRALGKSPIRPEAKQNAHIILFNNPCGLYAAAPCAPA